MLNLAASGGNPVEVMDLGLSLQAASLARIARDPSSLARGPQPVPADTNEAVARGMLSVLR